MNKEQIEWEAFALMTRHIAPCLSGWAFRWSRSKTMDGYVDRDKKVLFLSKTIIGLSGRLVRQLVRHEIAHVLEADSENHSAAWMRRAVRLGCSRKHTKHYRKTDP